MTEHYDRLEIISNYQIFKSPLQQEALKSNFYLQGFGEAVEEILTSNLPDNIDQKCTVKNYLEGRKDAIFSLENLGLLYEESVIDDIFNDLISICGCDKRNIHKKSFSKP